MSAPRLSRTRRAASGNAGSAGLMRGVRTPPATADVNAASSVVLDAADQQHLAMLGIGVGREPGRGAAHLLEEHIFARPQVGPHRDAGIVAVEKNLARILRRGSTAGRPRCECEARCGSRARAYRTRARTRAYRRARDRCRNRPSADMTGPGGDAAPRQRHGDEARDFRRRRNDAIGAGPAFQMHEGRWRSAPVPSGSR